MAQLTKYRLFAPGPTPVSEEASLAMAQTLIHHRTKEFESVLEEVRGGLKWLFQTKNEVLILASSGTGGMVGSVTNTLCRGDKVIVVDGGKFGERWWRICGAYGVEADIIKVPWGEAVDLGEIKKRLDQGGYRAVFVQASESSTGVYHPIQEIAALTKSQNDCLCIVDAISALGATNIPMDEWGVDVLITGSQKAMGLPPGLAMVALSDKAWGATERSDLPKFYFNFTKERKSIETNQTAFTPAISLITGLNHVLKKMKEEGLEGMFARHTRLAEAIRSGVKGMGLELYAKDPGNSLTAVKVPEGVDGSKVTKIMFQKYNMTIVGGQDAAKGKIFRVAHLGYFDDLDMITVMAAIEWTFTELGYNFEMGSGVAATMKSLAKSRAL